MADDPLELDAEQMRRMGYAVVDLLVPPPPFDVYLSLTNWYATAVRAVGAL